MGIYVIMQSQLSNNLISIKDANKENWVYKYLPSKYWPYAQLARWDRPIGWQLLLWPCLWGLTIAVIVYNRQTVSNFSILNYVYYAFLFLIGAIAMRGCGCTLNDLSDKDLDVKVDRTSTRPLASNRVSKRKALLFIAMQALVGLCVLLQFNLPTILYGLSSVLLVVIYPFMKRFTYWPQLFLGICFSWGALLGWTAIFAQLDWVAIFIYLACVSWIIGYDTIYAHQDREDDIIVGVFSTARLFGEYSKIAISILYIIFLIFMAISFYVAALTWPSWLGLIMAAISLANQIRILDINNGSLCLKLFKSNNWVGLYIWLGLLGSIIF